MLCPSCSNELALDGEFYNSSIDLDGISAAVGTVTITVVCKDCMHEFGEYDLELELDITEWAEAHSDEEEHELSVELDDESFDEYKNPNNGLLYPGATATVKVSCSCGSEIQYIWSNYEEPSAIMTELNS